MASTPEHISMALFCDFENVALGVRDANYDKFDIKRVLERLLLKGSIVVKKAYCDWDRYRNFKSAMHEANFELIEIPHVRQSGKNSADIRLVVDALDLCYTKSHVNTFVIISGDSDFSPLVSKLRENAKYVIGVGVKQSTSDLLTANCDEFIYYDDLVRESARVDARRNTRNNQPAPKRTPEEEARRKAEMEARRTKAVEMALETYEALVTDRDEGGKIWASVLKEAIKRRNPGFNENYYGFRTFGNLLEEAKARGLLEFGRDEKSSAFVFRGTGIVTPLEPSSSEVNSTDHAELASPSLPASNSDHYPIEQKANTPKEEDKDASEAAPNTSDRELEREGSSRNRRRGRGRDRDRTDHKHNRSVTNHAPREAITPDTATSHAPAATDAQAASATSQAELASTPVNSPAAEEPVTPVAAKTSATRRRPAAKKKTANVAVGTDQATVETTTVATPTAPAAKKTRRAPAKKAAAKTTRPPASDKASN